jgi:hypothetical protein
LSDREGVAFRVLEIGDLGVCLERCDALRGEASREALLRDWITIEEVTQSDQPLP